MLRFDRATYLSLLFTYILSVRLSNSPWRSDVSLFLEFTNIVSTLMNLLYCDILFLVIYFARYREHIIWRISFSRFSDVLPPFTWARAIGNLWSICLGVNILIHVAKSEKCPSPLVAFSEIFQIQNLQILIFYMGGQEFLENLDFAFMY